jgi:hypothetical protein
MKTKKDENTGRKTHMNKIQTKTTSGNFKPNKGT